MVGWTFGGRSLHLQRWGVYYPCPEDVPAGTRRLLDATRWELRRPIDYLPDEMVAPAMALLTTLRASGGLRVFSRTELADDPGYEGLVLCGIINARRATGDINSFRVWIRKQKPTLGTESGVRS